MEIAGEAAVGVGDGDEASAGSGADVVDGVHHTGAGGHHRGTDGHPDVDGGGCVVALTALPPRVAHRAPHRVRADEGHPVGHEVDRGHDIGRGHTKEHLA